MNLASLLYQSQLDNKDLKPVQNTLDQNNYHCELCINYDCKLSYTLTVFFCTWLIHRLLGDIIETGGVSLLC